MAVSIIQQPEEISFSRNRNIWGFKTDNLYSNPGTVSIVLLSFPNGPLTDGQAFDLTYKGDILQTFTAKDAPDDSGLQIRSGAGLTLLDWCNQFIVDLGRNFLISRDYSISLDLTGVDPRVKLTAKIADPLYDISVNVQTNVGLTLLANGVKKAKQQNFKIWMQLLVSNTTGTGFDVVQTDTFLDVDDSGECYPNLSKTLTEALIGVDKDFEQPDPLMPVVQRNRKSCRQYYIRYGEAYGSKQSIKKINDTAVKWVMLGKTGKAAEFGYSIIDTFYKDGFHSFLKQESLSKTVSIKQAEWLSLVWLAAPVASIKLHVKVFFTSGDPAEFDAFTAADVAKYDKITFPTGPTQLNLFGLYPDKTVTYYEVSLVDGASARMSEIRTYLMDYQYQPYSKRFSCLSSLGVYDTFVTKGAGSTEYELISQKASITETNTFRFEEGETIEFDVNLSHKETVLTGWLTKRELKRYRDFFLSQNKFEVRNGRAFPVMVNSRSIKEFKDKDNLFALEFETGYRFTEEGWTEDEEDTAGPLLQDVSEFWPPVSNPDPSNMDNLYYRKAQTYSQAQEDGFHADLAATIASNHAAQQAEIDALEDAMAGKSNTDHLHTGIYVPVGDFNNLQDDLGVALFDKGIWDPAYTIDPDDPTVIPGYAINDRVSFDNALWRSKVNENEAEPGSDPLKWEIELDGNAYTAALVNYFTKTESDARFAPIVHTHVIADVTGLQAALDGKSAITHTHTLDQILAAGDTSTRNMTVGDLSVQNLYVNGTTTTVNATTVEVADNLLLINKNEPGNGVTAVYAGIEVERGSLTNYRFVFDESDDLFKVGMTGDLQPVATREVAPLNNGFARWISANNRFESVALASVALSGAYADLSGKPTLLSQFTNDPGYVTSNGTGASGTWGISVSGNAATATLANNSVLLQNYSPDAAATVSTIVLRTTAGYIFGKYFNQDSPNSEAGTISQLFYNNGVDGFLRKASLAQVQTALGISGTNSGDQNLAGVLAFGYDYQGNAPYKVATTSPDDSAIIEYGYSSHAWKAGMYGLSNFASNLGVSLMFRTTTLAGIAGNALYLAHDGTTTLYNTLFGTSATLSSTLNFGYTSDSFLGNLNTIGLHSNNVLYITGGSSALGLVNSTRNAAIYVRANNQIEIISGGVSSAYFSTSGNVGIGTTSPDILGGGASVRALTVMGNTASQRGRIEVGTISSGTSDVLGGVVFVNNTTYMGAIDAVLAGVSNSSQLEFRTVQSGTPQLALTIAANKNITAVGKSNDIGTVAMGWSGGGYPMLGYNMTFTDTANAYTYTRADTSWALDFGNANLFRLRYGASGTTGATISYTDLFIVNASGAFKLANLAGTGTRMVVADSAGTLSTQAIPSGGGGGTVVTVGVISANGFAGTSSGGTNPDLTISTTVTGLLKGNGTAISAATAGTDYVTPSSTETFTNKSGNISMWTNNSGYITGITSGMVTGALGFTPYNSTNPAGYITSAALANYVNTTGDQTGISGNKGWAGFHTFGGVSSSYLRLNVYSAASPITADATYGSFHAYDDGTFELITKSSFGKRLLLSFGTASDITFQDAAGTVAFTSDLPTDTLADVTARGSSTTGNITVNGTLYATGDVIAYFSDERLKTGIEKITDPLAKLRQLNGVYYYSNSTAAEYGIGRAERQVGFLAADVQKVLPEVIFLAPFDRDPETGLSKSGKNYLTVQYDRILPLVVEGINQVASEVDLLKARVKVLESKLKAHGLS